MRTRLIAALAAAPLVLLSACGATGGKSDGSAATTSGPETTETTETTEATTTTELDTDMTDVDEWAADFCTSFKSWLDGIEEASNSVGDDVIPGDIESGKTAIAKLFGAASTQTQALASDLQDAGYPDIDDGDMLRDDLITNVEAFDEAARTAQTDAEALDVSNASEFQASAQELTDRFEAEVAEVADSFAQIDVDYPSRELTLAINTSCDF